MTAKNPQKLEPHPSFGRSLKAHCAYFGYSPSTYYRRLDRDPLSVPKPTYFGDKPMILKEDEEAWLERAKNGELRTHPARNIHGRRGK